MRVKAARMAGMTRKEKISSAVWSVSRFMIELKI
jgi:hypothetical protein